MLFYYVRKCISEKPAGRKIRWNKDMILEVNIVEKQA